MLKALLSSAAATGFALAPAFAQDAIDTSTTAELVSPPSVKVEVSGVQEGEGKVYVALQTEDSFAENEGMYTEVVEADDGEVEVVFEDVTPGYYAVAVFQDTDNNEALTLKNQRPDEPYGFSGEEQRGAPAFDEASIAVGDDTATTVELKGKTKGGM